MPKKNVDSISELLATCRDKVCELCMAKAVARPVEKKKDAVAKARSNIQQWEGNLPPPLHMLAEKILSSQRKEKGRG